MSPIAHKRQQILTILCVSCKCAEVSFIFRSEDQAVNGFSQQPSSETDDELEGELNEYFLQSLSDEIDALKEDARQILRRRLELPRLCGQLKKRETVQQPEESTWEFHVNNTAENSSVKRCVW